MEENEPLTGIVKTPKKLPIFRRFTYGVGHVLNDLCASMWFSYLLLYFHKVLQFTNSMAGGVLLLGQIADGICTPLIGYESDRTEGGICNYGRRKSWHLVGTICVLCTFVFIFQPVMGGVKAEDWARFIYYAPLVVIFQFGWAATQISHLSLIPELSSDDGQRVELNAIRYAFTVMSSICVYLVTYLLLHLNADPDDDSQGGSNSETSTSHNATMGNSLDPDDVPEFRYLVLIVVGIGAVFSAIFHFGTKEPRGGRRRSESELEDSSIYGSIQSPDVPRLKMSWKDWLKEPQFYQVTLLYMFTRLMVNIAQIYIPMYVTDSLKLSKDSVALVPLVVYISGFMSTFVAKPINKYLGRKMTYFVGAILYLGACIWMRFNIGMEVYGAAILLGAGGSTVLVTSLAFTADLIGRNTETGAFVYGAMSLTDKFSNGIAVEIIQLMQPCIHPDSPMIRHCCHACIWYYRVIMTYVTGAAAIGAIAVLATLAPVTIGKRKKRLDICNDNNIISGSTEDSIRSQSDGAIAKRPQPNGSLPQTDRQPHKELKTCIDTHVHSENIPHSTSPGDTNCQSVNHVSIDCESSYSEKPNPGLETCDEFASNSGSTPVKGVGEMDDGNAQRQPAKEVVKESQPDGVVRSHQRGDTSSSQDAEESSSPSQNSLHVDESGTVTQSDDNPVV